MVFDGAKLPSKNDTEADREAKREMHRTQGFAFLRDDKRDAANSSFQKAVDVTPEMAAAVMDELTAAGVAFVVAPYEADAQLAWMIRHGEIAAIITEDSDMVAYHCDKVLFKMDRNGRGQEYCHSKLSGNVPQDLDFRGWDNAMLLGSP